MSVNTIARSGNNFDFSALLGLSNTSSRTSGIIFKTNSQSSSSFSFDSFFRQNARSSLTASVQKMQTALTATSSTSSITSISGDEPVVLYNGAVVDVAAGVVLRKAGEKDPETKSVISGSASAKIDSVLDDPQLTTNKQQAQDIVKQLGLGNSSTWGIDSLAQDLAVFGLDFTAFSQNPDELAQTIRDKSLELIGELDKEFATAPDYDSRRRTITGASARLTNGIKNGGGQLATASASLSASFNINSVVSGLASIGSLPSRNTVQIGDTTLDASFIIGVGNVIVDPLVLDLAGNGIDLKGADEGVSFDMNGDGNAANMGFIQGDDALLFVDTHGDGIVHDGRQLFGNQEGHANGFEMLQSYDDNNDGVIDENDAIYDSLRVWVEKTEDGVCEAGETMSLREAGVASINVGYKDVREDDGKGNLIGQVGEFTREDGSSGLAADAWFQTAPKP